MTRTNVTNAMSQSAFITEKPPKSQDADSAVNKERIVTKSIAPQVTGSQRAHTDYDFELVDKNVLRYQWVLTGIGQ